VALVLAPMVVITSCAANRDVTREIRDEGLRSDSLVGRIVARWSALQDARSVARANRERAVRTVHESTSSLSKNLGNGIDEALP